MYKQFIYIFLALTGLCVISGCNSDKDDTVLRLGTSLDYPPFEFLSKGEPTGLDIDIAQALTKHLGYELKVIDMDFSGLIGALKAGKVDFVMAGMQANDERRKNVDFTIEYMDEDDLAVITKTGNEIKTAAEMKNKRIGTQLGSVMEIYLKELQGEVEGLEINAIVNNLALVEDLKVGRIDGVLLREMQAVEFTKANKGLSYTTLKGTSQGVAIAFKKGSKWVERFNEVIRKMNTSDEMATIKSKWVK